MDLGIKGRKAIVCGSSEGLGKACAISLAREGVEVWLVARTEAKLKAAAEEIRALPGVGKVSWVAADLLTAEGQAAILKACPEPDILITNFGNSPKGKVLSFDAATWATALDRHMIQPIMLIRSVLDGMVARKFGRVVNILSRGIKMPMAFHTLGNSPRAALSHFVGTAAREVAEHNVTINNVLPGPFATATQAINLKKIADKEGVDFETYAKRQTAGVPARRLGNPEELGDFCAYLCSAKAGYIVAQNLLIDGGVVDLV